MLKTISILLAFCFISAGLGKNVEESYKLIYPKYIPLNSPFNISFITANPYASADRMDFYILPGSSLLLTKVELKSLYVNKELNFSPARVSGYTGNAYKAEIKFNDSTLTSGVFFQILMTIRSEYSTSSSVKFMVVYMKEDSVLGYIRPKGSSAVEGDEDYIGANLNFYKPQKNAGRSLLFPGNSSLKFSGKDFESQNLLTEFWIKMSSGQMQFLTIKSKSDQNFQMALSTNAYQMLNIKSSSGRQEFLNPYFTGRKSWYHISVDFDFRKNTLSLYCNGTAVSRSQLPAFILPKDLVFLFSNPDETKSFQIDLLRFVDLKNSIDVSFHNGNFNNFISDSSSVLAQFKFDQSGDQLKNPDANYDIYFSGVQFVRSDAPIFARAPELNINPLANSYELDWSGGDYKQADHYVLQKSSGNSDYKDLFSVSADNMHEKNYSFLDTKDESDDVVYYRVKQVNVDGSEVYSSQVKVGQGMMEPFIVEQNYPNPFNPKTSIVVDLLQDSDLEVTVYNMEGKEVQQLFKGFISAGLHRFAFDATDLPSGVYLYKIATPKYTKTKKMILTK